MNSSSTQSVFYRKIIISSAIIFILSFYPVSKYASSIQLYSLIAGYILSLANAVIGFKLNMLSIGKPVKSFMALVFGGMGLRMIFIAIAVVLLIYVVKMDEISLVSSVFFFYIIFVTIELIQFHRLQLQVKGSGILQHNGKDKIKF